ncbi:DDE-type integrase/transposase/recombinase [Haloimpatiens sp. FM7330]|uniref:DDE-type integrase/transposase/recombinase n=1 Tax=Haloimpatiens sp. FM7330 TaxID=3298610 RepID=UPI00362B7999
MFEGSIKTKDAIAFFRYSVILPLLEAKPGTIRKTAYQLAHKTFHDPVNRRVITIGERTIYTYYANYRKYGFEGLKPKIKSNKGKHPSIPEEIIKEILALKEELPCRSAQKIIVMLELANKVDKDFLKVRTVNRILNFYGYTRESLSKDTRVYAKHEKKAVNVMWQSDIMEAFYISDANGLSKLVYLIGFIDDHSRRILHCQFYYDATLTRLEDCLKKAVIKFGAPSSLYVDNGKVYISDNFKLICAKLGIVLKYSTPYHPQGKGKIEVFWKYVQSSFVSEIKEHKVTNIMELNDMFQGWLKTEYHDKIHSSLGKTPIKTWEFSIENGTKLRFFSPVQLDEIFLHYAERTVNKYGVISFEGNTYEIDNKLVGKKIGLRYNPFHLDYVHVYYLDKYFGIAKIIDLKTQKHKSVRKLEEDPCVNSEISKQYLSNIKSHYQKYLQEQINVSLSKDLVISKEEKSVKGTTDEIISRAPKDKTYVIDKNEFVTIVSKLLDITSVTFAEKGKLYELWDTFKEFNREILISILTDIKENTPDFKKNFIYYLAQLKIMYLSKLNLEKHKPEVK